MKAKKKDGATKDKDDGGLTPLQRFLLGNISLAGDLSFECNHGAPILTAGSIRHIFMREFSIAMIDTLTNPNGGIYTGSLDIYNSVMQHLTDKGAAWLCLDEEHRGSVLAG